MTASASDLSLVLSGGSGNHNPNNSLGGNPSASPISGVLNNLFNDISETQAKTGFTDYRCFYLFNNNSSDAFYSLLLELDTFYGNETDVEIGVELINEIQRITLSGTITGGYLTISYTPPGHDPVSVNANYNANPDIWANNITNALNSIPTFSGVFVTAGVTTNIFFNVEFNDYRSHDLLTIDTSNLTGTSISGSVSLSVPGAPINSVPSELDVATTPPGNVEFNDSIEIGTLYAEEGIPIWVKRIIAPDSSGGSNVGFKLKITLSPVNV